MKDKLAELADKLEVEERRMGLAKAAAGFGVWDWFVEQNILIWDDAMFKMFEPRDKTNNYEMFRNCLHPNDVEPVEALLKSAFNGMSYDYRFRIITKGGEERYIRGHGAIVERDIDGHPKRMTGICLIA